MSKMRAHGAADARVTSGALPSPRRVFRGLGLGFQGLFSSREAARQHSLHIS